VDRRTSLKWMMAAASLPLMEHPAWSAEPSRLLPLPNGYGTDPNLVKVYRAGELWPLSFTERQRVCAAALCATIIPADAKSPSAAELNVHVFIDEWISAPYPRHVKDRETVLAGLVWLDEEAEERFKKPFAALTDAQRAALCDDICWVETAKPEFVGAARFFARFRDLTADGFYTTPEGMKDIGYTGNKPSATFAGPPPEALKKAGLIK
jgi:hypothetical protein